MSSWKWLLLILGTVLITAGGQTAPAQSPGGAGVIQGNVKSADGGPMEGVVVSARASGNSFTTSVFTDGQGNYAFPSLDAGQYRLWAQAVGFEAARSEFVVTGGSGINRNLTMVPIKDVGRIVKQMSGVEFLRSLPQSTAADRRMVHAYKNNCTGCHTASHALGNRWDARGWGVLVDLMTVFPSTGEPVPAMRPTPDRMGSPMIAAYRDELAEYLGRARGATELSDLKLLPRPTGEATQVVITEYDLPRTDGRNHFDDGSDWSMGTPSRFVGRAAHDVWLDAAGNVWMADDLVPNRTLAKLDPRTGKVTDFALKGEDGKTIATHSVVVDGVGRVWATGDGNFVMYDTRNGEFKEFRRPAGMRATVGGTLDVDSKGNPWATSLNGVLKLDAATGEYTHYEGPPAPDGLCGADCGGWGTYGNAVDRDDNVWATNPGLDRLLKIDSRTGKVTAVNLEPLPMAEVTEVDRQRRRTVRASQNSAPPGHKAPRRLAADPNADVIWVALYTADRLARVGTKTNQVKEYPLPTPYSSPYATAVDKNGTVWINTMNHDVLTKFDPKTERFTEYTLPTRGTEIRHVQVDNSTNPPTIWAPYNRTNKVVRIQFRTTPNQQTRAAR